MKAKELAEKLLKSPEAKVTLSVSNSDVHYFADNIIEVTTQGEKQLTIVADINKNCLMHGVMGQREQLCQDPDNCQMSYYSQINDYYCHKCEKTGLA